MFKVLVKEEKPLIGEWEKGLEIGREVRENDVTKAKRKRISRKRE